MKIKRNWEILKLYFKEARNRNCRQKVKRMTAAIAKIDKKYEV